jgi:hypothetical protein
MWKKQASGEAWRTLGALEEKLRVARLSGSHKLARDIGDEISSLVTKYNFYTDGKSE